MRYARAAVVKAAHYSRSSQTVDLLRSAHRDYHLQVSQAYDEVLHEVSDRVASQGSLGKADIGALLFWKRLRADTPWAGQLSSMTDAAVRDVTGLRLPQSGTSRCRPRTRHGAAAPSSAPFPASGQGTRWLPLCSLPGLPSAWLSTTAERRRLSERSGSN